MAPKSREFSLLVFYLRHPPARSGPLQRFVSQHRNISPFRIDKNIKTPPLQDDDATDSHLSSRPCRCIDTAAIRAAYRDLTLHVAVAAQEPPS